MGELEMLLSEVFSELGSGIATLNLFSSGLGIVVYVLQALTLYTIAERREIKHPWLAWIPLVNVWILGSVSDQYQYVVKGKVKNKRKVLLGLDIALTALVIVLVVFIIWGVFAGVLMMEPSLNGEMSPVDLVSFENVVGALLVVIAFALPIGVLAVVRTVFCYIAMYDLYCSCDPDNSALYLVLSIVGSFVIDGAYSICMLVCKDKDLGMPPRKPVPQSETVAEPILIKETYAREQENPVVPESADTTAE